MVMRYFEAAVGDSESQASGFGKFFPSLPLEMVLAELQVLSSHEWFHGTSRLEAYL